MQKISVYTIEDCLEVLTGLQKHNLTFTIETSDRSLIDSIARQIYRGTALTDRQYALMREKLNKYRDQFENQGVVDFDQAFDKLRNPLREIDRSKYITVVNYIEDMPTDASDRNRFIKIRFPFKKSDIALINEINSTKGNYYYHKKGSHEHYFIYNEQNADKILSRFKDKSYKIDQELLDLFIKIERIREHEQDYVPGIYNGELKNIHPNAKRIAEIEIGKFNTNTALMYIDRRFRYGLERIHQIAPTSLIEKIAYRSEPEYQSKPAEEPLEDILQSLCDLKRFPLLIILEKSHAESQLYKLLNFYKDIVPEKQQSVLFRQDGGNNFNQLVKEHKLNNWVDNNTKIVYISSDKLPKLLVSSKWQPCTAFSYTSRLDRILDSYVYNRCDLIVYREDMLSPIRRHSQYYG
jgi:hypothetical protein